MPSTSRLQGMSLSGKRILMIAMALSSSCGPMGALSCIGVPSWGTKVMARICWHPRPPILRMVSALSRTLSPRPIIMPSSASSPASMAQTFWFRRSS